MRLLLAVGLTVITTYAFAQQLSPSQVAVAVNVAIGQLSQQVDSLQKQLEEAKKGCTDHAK